MPFIKILSNVLSIGKKYKQLKYLDYGNIKNKIIHGYQSTIFKNG